METPFHGVDDSTMKTMMRSLAVLRSVKADALLYKIDEHIYLGTLGVALNRDTLVQGGITHISCVARGIKNIFQADFKYLNIEMLDSLNESLLDHLPIALAWISQAVSLPQTRILIHCFAGRSRSVALVLAYLMVFQGLTLRSAYHHVRSIRPSANPNTHFMRHLKGLDLELQSLDRSSVNEVLLSLETIIPKAKLRAIEIISTDFTPKHSSGYVSVDGELVTVSSVSPWWSVVILSATVAAIISFILAQF